MIIEFLLGIVFTIITFIFSWFSLPGSPDAWQSAIDNIVIWFATPLTIIKNYVGESFFNVMLTLVIALAVFNFTMYPGMWLYNKIRGSG